MKHILLGMSLFAAVGLSAQVTNYNVGEVVDDFTVTDVDGNVHNLYTYANAGKYIILDFFFDTCPPCQATAPFFNELHETYGCNQGDLICLTINNGTDTDAEVIAYENTYGGNFNHSPAISADGGGGAVNTAFGISAFPTYCLIGPDKTLVNADIWPISDMSTFVGALPASVTPMACGTVNVSDQVFATTPLVVYPNPANDVTFLNFGLATETRVRISVINLVGEEVILLTEGRLSAGEHRFNLNLENLANGVYMIRMQANDKTTTQRLVVQ